MIWSPGCIDRAEGCLDPNAQNFDFNADRACDTCCIYPKLSVTLSQKWGDENFVTTDTLYDSQQQPFLIRDLKYILSSFKWIDTDGNIYTVDSARIACGTELISFSPDLLLIDSRQFNYVLDSIEEFPAVESVMFTLGWQEELACVESTADKIPTILSDESPLWDDQLQQRAAIRIVMQRDTAVAQFDTVFIHTSHQFDIPYEVLFTVGKPQTLLLTVQYEEWFQGFDVTELHELQHLVLQGIAGSVTRTP